MRVKNVRSYTSMILFIFIIFGTTICSEAFVRKITIKDVLFGSGKVLETKIISDIFSVEGSSHPIKTIDTTVDSGRFAMIDGRRHLPSDLLKWNMEVDHKIFQIFINRDNMTVTIKGEVENRKEKEKVEHVIKLRAPANFEIINKIDIYHNDLG